ncbi:hypothetical protein BCR32DRAFT_280034 [Anaeromyces robustus]|uniref:Uncharacterized protein n=1 Tax=Anaeromyces robustus TaxID=1754192 RepID=A0A1Y1X6P8_9FUNG|nr:hypothetical protein BCR32DRAFT_280034 [Anaeromyces robustus]|eukprot:ORX81056.1 hypothetical protein BCR32DRAFT_280034 [Anaeromyces robustus]
MNSLIILFTSAKLVVDRNIYKRDGLYVSCDSLRKNTNFNSETTCADNNGKLHTMICKKNENECKYQEEWNKEYRKNKNNNDDEDDIDNDNNNYYRNTNNNNNNNILPEYSTVDITSLSIVNNISIPPSYENENPHLPSYEEATSNSNEHYTLQQ